jgi:hypothetical protein
VRLPDQDSEVLGSPLRNCRFCEPGIDVSLRTGYIFNLLGLQCVFYRIAVPILSTMEFSECTEYISMRVYGTYSLGTEYTYAKGRARNEQICRYIYIHGSINLNNASRSSGEGGSRHFKVALVVGLDAKTYYVRT